MTCDVGGIESPIGVSRDNGIFDQMTEMDDTTSALASCR